MNNPTPRLPKGFQDTFAAEVLARQEMIQRICEVYRLHGFDPLETPGIEYVETLGKFLPESATPEGGIFALQDDDDQWIALRYDLTAPLSRVVAQYGPALPSPYRRYQAGPVWRKEKPGPGRFRQFTQCDIDTVGTADCAADAEVCAVLVRCFDALEIGRGNFVVKVNDRMVLDAVLERAGIPQGAIRMTVLRAMDKYDRLGIDGVRDLLGKGRADASGDFTTGANLAAGQDQAILDFLQAQAPDRRSVLALLGGIVGTNETGRTGLANLSRIDAALDAMGIESSLVEFDPSIVRGLAYYTGPVLEAVLTFEATDEDGNLTQFGSVAGGGRYDDLVARFTGARVPAVGASIGVDRLLAALRHLGRLRQTAFDGPVVVTRMDATQFPIYQQMAADLRNAGIRAELYLGEAGFRKQMKYADQRQSPVAVIAGGDELAAGTVSLKNLRLGAELAKSITDRDSWAKDRPAQITIRREDLVSEVRKMLEECF